MNWHIAAYNESVGAVTNEDINASADAVFVRRNNHLIFTDRFNIIGVFGFGSLLSRLRFGNISLTQLGNNHIWPLEVSATVPDLPQGMDFRDGPMAIPLNEELTIEGTTTAVGPSDVNAGLLIATPEWHRNFPSYIQRFVTRATVVIAAGAESAWTEPVEIVLERDLKNGVYAVVGCAVVAANATFFRLRFPDQPKRRGRQLRPGGLVQDAANLQPHPMFMGGLGEWGRFHTFSLPEIQTHDDTAGGTYEVRLDLLYLGEDESLLQGD